MKKRSNLIYIFLFLIFIVCVAEHCDDDKGIKNLNSIVIPEYGDSDYIKLLDEKNPEMVYNAVCNLISYAQSYAETLSDTSINDSNQRKQQAMLVYNKITSLLTSKNEWIVCSSLRFYSNFASSYKNKDELVSNLLKVKLKSKSIRLEYINAMESLKNADLKPFSNILDDFLKNKSWLISRYAYQVIPYTRNSGFHAYLITKYKTAADYDKLLIISSIENKYNDSILDFITSELKYEQNKTIKRYLAKQLGNARNTDKVVSWMNLNSTVLNDIKDPLSSYYFNKWDSASDIRIATALAGRNLVSESVILDSNEMFMISLYASMQKTDNQNFALLKEFEKALLNNGTFKTKWLDFKVRQDKSYYSAEFIALQQKQLNDFRQKSARLYDEYKLPKDAKKRYLDNIKNLENEFSKNEEYFQK